MLNQLVNNSTSVCRFALNRPLRGLLGLRWTSTTAQSPPPTGIVMLNMGGPEFPHETGDFLHRLFTDREIINLGPLQRWLGPLLAKRRTPRIQQQYQDIGGSPIRKWTDIQGRELCARLDKLSPETAPHKHYIAFRYANPLTESCLQQMQADGVQRAVAFSQYPQWSCTTAGSSLNHLWREAKRMGLKDHFRWSVIDRWPTHPTFIEAVVARMRAAIDTFEPLPPSSTSSTSAATAGSAGSATGGVDDGTAPAKDEVVIVFSAHSLPMRVVNRGDPYPQEVAATVQAVMTRLHQHTVPVAHRYMLAWQSQVGPLPWLGPQTGDVLKSLGKRGLQRVLVVPIAFTSDHVETLFEIDKEYAHMAAEAGITQFRRAAALNDEPLIFQAMAEIAAEHLQAGRLASSQYSFNCPSCVNPDCRKILNPAASPSSPASVPA